MQDNNRNTSIRKLLTSVIFIWLIIISALLLLHMFKSNQVTLTYPSNLRAEFLQEDYILLTWSSVKGARGYEVYFSKNDDNEYVKLGNVKASIAIMDISREPKKGDVYHFKVCAYADSNEKSNFSYPVDVHIPNLT